MLKHRVIPSLLLAEGGLVKTRRFAEPKYVGDPINAIRIFNEKEVDELIVLDILASKQNREPNYALIEEFAGECFMPLCYGGGIKNFQQAKKIFSLGVEKICLQTSILADKKLITEIAQNFGNQSIVVSVDVKKNWFGTKKLFASACGKTLNTPLQSFLRDVVKAGAGEILLNSVDRDGMMSGMDLDLIESVTGDLPIPIIASGGAGSLQDMKNAIKAGASAVAAGAFFVFHGPHRAVLITYPSYNDLEALEE